MQSVGGRVPKGDLLRLRRQVNDLQGELEQSRLAIPRAQIGAGRSRQADREGVLDLPRPGTAGPERARGRDRRPEGGGHRPGEDRVRRTEVRSPVRGTVKTLKIATIGGVVQPGADLAEIVPLEDTLLVEAQIRPADIAFLAPGQPAMVKITAYDFSIYGGLAGEARGDQRRHDRRTSAARAVYRVRVRTDRNHLGTAEPALADHPGHDRAGRRAHRPKTVLDYLLKPILRARAER